MLGYWIHHQFIESWQRLSVVEQDSVFHLLDLLKSGQITPGMRPHKVGPFLSLSPNMDLRILALVEGSKTTLFHVGHHDAAYQWAKQKIILVSGIESSELIDINDVVSLRTKQAEDGFYLPIPIQDVLSIENEDVFLNAITNMSPEWQEWLLNSYKNTKSQTSPPMGSSLVFCPNDDEELKKALKLDIPGWQLFLHPIQRNAVDDLTSKSIAISGGPGTGKTVVLLNRLIAHAPRGKDEDCSVLLTYSADLANYLLKTLKAKPNENKHFSVLPLYLLGGSPPERMDEDTAFKSFRLENEQGQLFLWRKNHGRKAIRELLVDELQDSPIEVTQILQSVIGARKTRVVLASDLDQSIHRLNQKDVIFPISLCEKKYELTYCYRSTRQIIEKATQWLSVFNLESSNSDIYALSGPSVRFIACENLNMQVYTTRQIVHDLQSRYAPSGIAVIFCQYYNREFKGLTKERETLINDIDIKKYLRFASVTKGKEYFAGVVFISNTFLAKEVGIEAKRLRINTLYVALTRFRDEVTIIYTEGCAIESQLEQLLT